MSMYRKSTSDNFLSEEDLDLKNLSWDELVVYWNAWLRAASYTDQADEDEYSHGVFRSARERPGGDRRRRTRNNR